MFIFGSQETVESKSRPHLSFDRAETYSRDPRTKPAVKDDRGSSYHLALDDLTAERPFLALSANEVLFHEGEKKTDFYRVEAGLICVTAPSQIIAIANPGDLIGLGFLKHHAYTARAHVDSFVSCLPISAISDLADRFPEFKALEAGAFEQEFATRREALISAAPVNPVQRVAVFLVIASRGNEAEHRDPLKIDDTISCGAVATLLGMDIETLGKALVELKKLRCIEECSTGGLYIRNHVFLERLAEARVVRRTKFDR